MKAAISAPRRDGTRFAKLSIRTVSDTGEKNTEQTALRDLDCRRTISGAHRCDHHVALSRKPKCGVAEFDYRKVASARCVKRNPMVHHDEWKWTAGNGPD